MPRDIGDVSTIGEVTADYLVRIVDNPNSDYPVEKLIPGAELTPAAGGVSVADAGGYYTGTNVETVLAELPAKFLPLNGAIPDALRPDVTMVAHACASGHGWTDTKAGGTVDLNYTTDYFLGSQSIRLVTNGAGASCRVDKLSIPSFSMTARGVVLWLKVVSGISNGAISRIELYLGDGGAGWTNFTRIDILSGTFDATSCRLREGSWARVTVPWESFLAGGSPTRSAIVQLRLNVIDKNLGTTAEVLLGGVGYQAEPTAYPNGVVTFTFDDGYDDVYDIAAPLMDRYGWAGTAYIINETIDNPSVGMNLAELVSLQKRGWDIGCHAYTSAAHNTSATGLTTAALEADLDAQIAWMHSNGLRAAEHWAYPLGNYNDAVLDVARQRFTACVHTRWGGSQGGQESVVPGEALELGRYPLSTGITLAAAQTQIDRLVLNNGWRIFMLHKLAATAEDSITWATADFASLLAYCATNGVAVKTMSEVINSAR